MERPTCKTCPYWDVDDDDRDDETQGRCRRNPPKIVEAAVVAFASHDTFHDKTTAIADATRNALTTACPSTCGLEWCGRHPDFPAYVKSLEVKHPDDK